METQKGIPEPLDYATRHAMGTSWLQRTERQLHWLLCTRFGWAFMLAILSMYLPRIYQYGPFDLYRPALTSLCLGAVAYLGWPNRFTDKHRVYMLICLLLCFLLGTMVFFDQRRWLGWPFLIAALHWTVAIRIISGFTDRGTRRIVCVGISMIYSLSGTQRLYCPHQDRIMLAGFPVFDWGKSCNNGPRHHSLFDWNDL